MVGVGRELGLKGGQDEKGGKVIAWCAGLMALLLWHILTYNNNYTTDGEGSKQQQC